MTTSWGKSQSKRPPAVVRLPELSPRADSFIAPGDDNWFDKTPRYKELLMTNVEKGDSGEIISRSDSADAFTL